MELPKLSLRQIVKLWADFIGSEWNTYSKEEKWKWINSYRNVEKENNAMIGKYGSITAWYESGEGRLLNL